MLSLKTVDGFNMEVLNKSERNAVFAEICKPINQKYYFTPQDNYRYEIINESWNQKANEIKLTIKTNGIIKEIKTSIEKQDTKIMAIVRKLNGVK